MFSSLRSGLVSANFFSLALLISTPSPPVQHKQQQQPQSFAAIAATGAKKQSSPVDNGGEKTTDKQRYQFVSSVLVVRSLLSSWAKSPTLLTSHAKGNSRRSHFKRWK